MKIIIQCAKSKRSDLAPLRNVQGKIVKFVAQPKAADLQSNISYVHPDDPYDDHNSWRDHVAEANEANATPTGFCQAIDLYTAPAYQELKSAFDAEDIYILSAGWGLVRSDYLLPSYDITFSSAGSHVTRRKARQTFQDFNHLDLAGSDELAFLGGRAYIDLFCRLTSSYKGQRTIFYNSITPPYANGCILHHYDCKARTNWHYLCASDLARTASGIREI